MLTECPIPSPALRARSPGRRRQAAARAALSGAILCLGAVLLTASPLQQSGPDYTPARTERRLRAVRTPEKIVIDGSLDETAWNTAPVATDFTQHEPREGWPATYRTEVRVLYDSSSLYLGIKNFDDQPDKILSSDLKKDFSPPDNDGIGIVLDTFHDRRNGFEFFTNPQGAKWDGQSSNESDRNTNWDAVWFVKTRTVQDGWIAEIAIPFKTLRFQNTPAQTWGINFLRRVRRLNEDSFWSPIPRIYRLNRVSLAGTLEGLEGIQPGGNLRVKPYFLSSLGQVRSPTGLRSSTASDAGLDLKWGLGSALILDATLNTDFSQVEADEQQVNLTRFSLFFPEKRDFFLENSGIFSFGTLGELVPRTPTSGSSGRQSGGGEDFIFFFSRRIGINDDGQQIPIFGGGRLTGRVGDWSLGLLNIQTRESGATPSTNFSVARVRRNLFASSQVGAIYINKEGGRRFNRGYGVDGTFRFGTSFYLNTFYARTASPGVRSQNDAYRVAAALRNRFWDIRWIYNHIGSHFDAQVGFVPRTGVKNLSSFIEAKLRPAWLPHWVREITPRVEPTLFWTQANRLETRYVDLRVPIILQDGGRIEFGRDATFERLFRPFRIQGGNRIAPGDYDFGEFYATFSTSRARPLSVNLSYRTGDFYSGRKTTSGLGGTIRFSYHLTTSINYSRNDVRLPATQFATDLVTARFNYSFTTSMFLNALIQYNTDAKQWSSNIRFNIIHRPLSDFYLVYNERRDTISGGLIDRALIGKLTWLFGG